MGKWVSIEYQDVTLEILTNGNLDDINIEKVCVEDYAAMDITDLCYKLTDDALNEIKDLCIKELHEIKRNTL